MSSKRVKILVCRLDDRIQLVKSDRATVAHNPVSCLNAATTQACDLIILCFSIRSIRTRGGLVELCRCLKSNSLTRQIPVFVSVDRWQRALSQQLKEAGLDFLDLRLTQNRIDPEQIFKRTMNAAISVHIDQVVSRLCPYLTYKALNGHSELVTCGAWRNRIVLGGSLLREVCETENHLHCQYFMNPRPKP